MTAAAIGTSNEFIWYASRATGIVALLLLSASVVLGVLTTTRSSTPAWPRFAVADLHRRVSLVAMVFLAIHVLTAVLDTFVPIGLSALVVPFVSHYQPVWMGLGTVAFDLMLAVTVSSMLRRWINPRLWLGIHWLAYVSWPVAIVHTIETGTDLAFGWAAALVGLCIAAVAAAAGWRVWASPHRGGHRTATPPRAAGRAQRADLGTGSMPLLRAVDRRSGSATGGEAGR